MADDNRLEIVDVGTNEDEDKVAAIVEDKAVVLEETMSAEGAWLVERVVATALDAKTEVVELSVDEIEDRTELLSEDSELVEGNGFGDRLIELVGPSVDACVVDPAITLTVVDVNEGVCVVEDVVLDAMPEDELGTDSVLAIGLHRIRMPPT